MIAQPEGYAAFLLFPHLLVVPQNKSDEELAELREKRSSTFEGAILNGSSFRFARLQGVNFSNAKLVDVDFSGADLDRVSFSGADLQGAKIGNKWKGELPWMSFNVIKTPDFVDDIEDDEFPF